MKKVIVRLPWPNSKLFPNRKGGMHWSTYQSEKAKARRFGSLAAAMTGEQLDLSDQYSVRIEFYAPDRRLRDLDGLYGAIKHAQDGVCKALGIDDSKLNPVVLVRRIDPDKVGYVVMTLEGDGGAC